MQDEITKHSRKIYKTLKNSKKPIIEKSKEIFIEIFIIVFSVTLSIWLHSWTQEKHQQKEAMEFLIDLKDDLNKDIESMSKKKVQLSEAIKQYSYLKNLTKERIDSLSNKKQGIDIAVSYVIRKTNNGNYEGFKSSGKIGFIENKKLKKMILEYYQEDVPSTDEAEKYYNSRLSKIEDLIFQDKDKKKKFLDPVLKMSFGVVIQIAENNKRNYDAVSKDVREIINEINREEKK
ncbi:hypothetical protein Palpr_2033 [Paludibacter propionicigenes WB4]|uniref:Uncharacterized protein n=1 Tax=Paludibacter propionicigenes (strain DSM 17365 / JCM 13257 / WB4) TaxID=694427 RepID=E4T626_PALPW|nr:hypothetical protein [Paludibacter propionicigenes]ADQ80170.1 hypothetical protein Palpr_2033 [Paludibacter propionicigenes WB4]